jgi:hypothetical protein
MAAAASLAAGFLVDRRRYNPREQQKEQSPPNRAVTVRER